MRRKSETLQVTAEAQAFQDFMPPVNSSKLKQLMAQSRYFGREPRNRVQLNDAMVKLFQEAIEIDIKTCTEDEWTERTSFEGETLKLWQSFIKVTKEETHYE